MTLIKVLNGPVARYLPSTGMMLVGRSAEYFIELLGKAEGRRSCCDQNDHPRHVSRCDQRYSQLEHLGGDAHLRHAARSCREHHRRRGNRAQQGQGPSGERGGSHGQQH